jgi:HD-GYP domain-containing protein (c-di-GMP phosphodiesterase class II)
MTGNSDPQRTAPETAKSFQRLIEIGIALSAERDHNRLLETILVEAMDLCNADGGSLYLKTAEDMLRFEIMRTTSLGIAMGGTTGRFIPFPPLRMYDEASGKANHKNVSTHVALTGETVNIPDAYEAEGFDFSGTRKFDKGSNYRSTSFLSVPMKNHEGEVIGVLQLLNAQNEAKTKAIPFSGDIQPLIEALASQAAVALDNQQLLAAQKNLLDSFIELIAGAIDAKSPYTGGHCQRVPELARMLAEAADGSSEGPFKDFTLTDDDRYELQIASLLHDCGKVTTPEYVVDKATKLETINDRIHEVRGRFEILKRDAEIDYYKALAEGNGDREALEKEMDGKLAELDDDFAFIAECNIGGEFMADEKIERVKKIATRTWTRTLDDRIGVSVEEFKRMNRTPPREIPCSEPLLADKDEHIFFRDPVPETMESDPHCFNMNVPEYKYNRGEVYNLCIAKGTLTAEERYKINHHIVQTIMMLEQLPFPKNLSRVAEYAGGHHETMIGTGYPRKLEKNDMSLPARIMAVADIFEALTACDRPYKKAKTLSESIRILNFMKKDRHVDPDLFALFLKSGVYRDYAEKFLMAEQIDEVDIAQYLDGGAL